MGKYVKENLAQDEKVIYEAQIHGILFLDYWYVWILGLIGLIIGPGLVIRCFALVAMIIIWLFIRLAQVSSEYAVTNKRVIIKFGILTTHSMELQLSKIESVIVSQGLLGNLLGYRSIRFTGTGGHNEIFRNIKDPMAFKKAVQNQIG